jgi:hypothetical protein
LTLKPEPRRFATMTGSIIKPHCTQLHAWAVCALVILPQSSYQTGIRNP